MEKTSKDLEELNDRFEMVSFEEEGLKEERENLEIDLAYADLQDIKAKCKSAESASRKRDKEHDQLKVLEKCTKNFIEHSRLAFNNHESNIDC